MPIEPSDLDRMLGRPWRHRTAPQCPECGYNLTGLTSSRCPECGTPVQRGEVEQMAREAAGQLVRLKGINDVLRAGLGVAVGTAALLVMCWAFGYPGIARVFGLIGGFAAFGLGLSVLRAGRLSAEVRELLREKPNYGLGLGTAALGVLLLVVSILLP